MVAITSRCTAAIAAANEISYFDTNFSCDAKSGEGKRCRGLTLPVLRRCVARRGVDFAKELRNLSSRPYLLLDRYEYSVGFYFTCSPLPRVRPLGQGLMKLAEKNANKMPDRGERRRSCALLSPLPRRHQPSRALVRGALRPDKNIRKRKLEAPPFSANLLGNLSRGSYTLLSRVMTRDTFCEIFMRTRHMY